MIVAAIGPDQADKREVATRDLQQGAAAVAILHVGGMRLDQQRPAVGIDQRMALASFDLFARIIAARAAAFRGFDALILSLPKDDCR